jgi:hypothetical protein
VFRLNIIKILCLPKPLYTMIQWWKRDGTKVQWWKHDGTTKKQRWHDNKFTTMRWHGCENNIAFSTSSHRNYTIVPLYNHHRSSVFSPSHHHVSSSCFRCFAIVPLLFHHRSIFVSRLNHCVFTIVQSCCQHRTVVLSCINYCTIFNGFRMLNQNSWVREISINSYIVGIRLRFHNQ